MFVNNAPMKVPEPDCGYQTEQAPMTHPEISKASGRSAEKAEQAGLQEDRLRAQAVHRKGTP
jgi:hypothetical protein